MNEMPKSNPAAAVVEKTPDPLAELTANLGVRRRDVAEAEAAVTAAETAFQASLRDPDKFATPRAAAARDDAAAALGFARQRLEAGEAALAEERERVAEADRLAKRADLTALLAVEVPKQRQAYLDHALPIVQVVRGFAELDKMIRAVNADRRDDEPVLPDTATLLSGGRFIPEQLVEETTERLWVFAQSGQVLGPDQQKQVRTSPMRSDASPLALECGYAPYNHEVELRVFRRRRVREAVDRGHGRDLAQGIVLPAIEPGAPPIWDGSRGSGPDFVLAYLAELAARRKAFDERGDEHRPVVERFEPLTTLGLALT